MADRDRPPPVKDERQWALKRLSEVVAERRNMRVQQAQATPPRDRRLKSVDDTRRKP
jgi:hypothetical protein